jgi:hypothetical protein
MPTTQSSSILTSQSEGFNRTAFLSHFDYIEMRCRLTQTELAKKPSAQEQGVIFHSPRDPSVTYDIFFQTTHDFLDISAALQMFPLFIDLPLGLRPSKAHYDATKNNPEDLTLRVRCLFCRGRFGGKNAKAIWERHVKEHWPKAGMHSRNLQHNKAHKESDRSKEVLKEEIRRPVRHIQKRSVASSHGRTRSRDGDSWAPPSFRRFDRSCTPASSRAPSPTPSTSSVSIASSDYFSHAHEHGTAQEDDTIVIDNFSSHSDAPMTPVSTPDKPKDRAHLVLSPVSDEDRGHFRIGSWDVEAHLAELNRLARPCLSKEKALEAITAAAERSSPRKDNDFLFNGSMDEDEDLTVQQSASVSDKKRSRRDSIYDDFLDQDLYVSEPETKRRRVDSFRSDSSSGSSGYDSGFDCSFDEIDSPSSFDSPTSPFLALDN